MIILNWPKLVNKYENSSLLSFKNKAASSHFAEKNTQNDAFEPSHIFIARKRAEMLKNAANVFAENNKNERAIDFYKAAIEINPDYIDVYHNLAKTYKNIGQVNNAIVTYEQALQVSPNNIEALAKIGECYKDMGEYDKSANYLQRAVGIDSKYDLAWRLLKETANLKLAGTNPEQAQREKDQQAQENLTKSIGLIKVFLSKEARDDLRDVEFVFNDTNSLSGHKNIAQYENDKRRIVITDKYIWAAPQIISAYIAHEAVHARDHDAYTSIKEEQDAYRESAKFWVAHNDGVEDPEMDFVVKLYRDSPESLDKKVEEIYSSRDSSIQKFSPKHGIAAQSFEPDHVSTGFDRVKEFFTNMFSERKNAANPQVSSDQGLLSHLK